MWADVPEESRFPKSNDTGDKGKSCVHRFQNFFWEKRDVGYMPEDGKRLP
jgi:hypothetical protein